MTAGTGTIALLQGYGPRKSINDAVHDRENGIHSMRLKRTQELKIK